MCLFPNAVVNNHADLWTVKRLARANDELGAMNRMMASTLEHAGRVTLEYQAGPTGYVEDQASGLRTIRPMAVSSGAYRIRVSIVIGCSGRRRRLAGP